MQASSVSIPLSIPINSLKICHLNQEDSNVRLDINFLKVLRRLRKKCELSSGNAGMHHDIHPTENSQGKWNKILDSSHSRTGDQIVTIDLGDETKMPRY
jgi:hypothetical protein